RSAIDFPLAGIALSCSRSADGALHFKAAVTGTNSRPFLIEGFDVIPPGADLDVAFDELEKLVQRQVSPQRTSTTASHYRRVAVSAMAKRLAAELAEELGTR
ncbi:MAG: 4-hydroxybenzoyl-CoA reductase subunit beta, partial [Hyphomicrobiales bacterium]